MPLIIFQEGFWLGGNFLPMDYLKGGKRKSLGMLKNEGGWVRKDVERASCVSQKNPSGVLLSPGRIGMCMYIYRKNKSTAGAYFDTIKWIIYKYNT